MTHTLTKMAWGGIYDQLGGGFHRYSTDDLWLVPHFEKMLYDKRTACADLSARMAGHGQSVVWRIVEETLDYVRREMTDLAGGFYGAQDATARGGRQVLPLARGGHRAAGRRGRYCSRHFTASLRGNFHERGPGAKYPAHPAMRSAAGLRRVGRALYAAVERGRNVLFEARTQRIAPGRDDKVLVEWNGLMLHAFAEAGAADRPDHRDRPPRRGSCCAR